MLLHPLKFHRPETSVWFEKAADLTRNVTSTPRPPLLVDYRAPATRGHATLRHASERAARANVRQGAAGGPPETTVDEEWRAFADAEIAWWGRDAPVW